MTWTAVGSLLFNDSASLAVSNTATGNLLLAEVLNYTNSTVWCTGFSGGGATWNQLGAKFSGINHAFSAAVFAGTVTATGAGTAVPSWSGTAPAGYEITGHEFHSTAGGWALDGSQGNMDGAADTATWVSLTPASGGALYFGMATNSISSPVAGSTSGYTYAANGDGDGAAWNLSCAAGTPTAPVWGDAHWGFGVMVLVAETSGINAVLASGAGAALNPSIVTSTVTIGPKYAGAAADLGGVYGSWGTPNYATGGP